MSFHDTLAFAGSSNVGVVDRNSFKNIKDNEKRLKFLEKALKELEVIRANTNQILQEKPDPVVRFRLLRDVLKVSTNSDLFVEARNEMLKSC